MTRHVCDFRYSTATQRGVMYKFLICPVCGLIKDIASSGKTPTIDGVSLSLGDRIEITPDNAQEYRDIIGGPVADYLSALKGEDSKERGVYQISTSPRLEE